MSSPNEPTATATRRDFLIGVGGAMAAALVTPAPAMADARAGWPVALTDISLGLRHSIGAFAVARSAGAAGVDVDFGRLGGRPQMDTRLTDASGRRRFLDAAHGAGVRISSLTMNAFAEQPFADHPKATTYVGDLIDTLAAMAVRVGVLPIGRRCDLAEEYTRDACVDRLRAVAPLAERGGVILAIDFGLPPRDVARLLDAVSSPAVQAVLPAAPGGGIAAAVATVGLDRVAQVRFQYDDDVSQAAALGALREALGSGWPGWIVVDRPATCGGDVLTDATLATHRLTSSLAPANV